MTTDNTPSEAYFLARNMHRLAGQDLFQKTSAHVAAMVETIPPEQRLERLGLILTTEMINFHRADEASQMLIQALADALRDAASLSQFKRHTMTVGA